MTDARRALPLALALFAALTFDARPTGSQPASPGAALAARLRELVAASGLTARDVGVHVLDVGAGTALFAHNPDAMLNPASNAKIVTAAAALAGLHLEYRWLTSVHARTDGGIVSGSIYLRGVGGPRVDSVSLHSIA